VHVYPVPTSGVVQIKYQLKQPSDFRIVNESGSLILQGQNFHRQKIDLSTYPSGIYYFVFENKEESFVKKVLIEQQPKQPKTNRINICFRSTMITLISGTNREKSLTLKFANIYRQMLLESGATVELLSLDEIPAEILLTDIYEKQQKPEAVELLQEKYFLPAEKFVFIFPEYNGSIPGVLKLLIDSMDPKRSFQDKKASLIGIASGRAGNLRGLDHLAAILHHMKVTVMPYLLPVSRVQGEFGPEGGFSEATEKLVRDHVRRTIEM